MVTGSPRLRVLVVDDNPAIHTDFAKILRRPPASVDALAELAAEVFEDDGPAPRVEQLDLELHFAHQGAEAVALVADAVKRGQPYALAFVDVRMPPGLDGVEAVAAMWEIDAALQVVLCTAYTDRSWEDMGRALGQRDGFLVLRKPFDPIEVLQLAHALVGRWIAARDATRHMGELERLVAERTRALEQSNRELELEVEAKRAAETELLRLATHDTLTGLPNRAMMMDRLAAALRRTTRTPAHLALLLVDLDEFKEVNDTYGHAAGDELLRQTAARLTRSVRACDTVARMGGDEFVVLLVDLATPEDAAEVAARIVASCSEPVAVGDRLVRSSPSVGIALSPGDARDAATMLQCADLAMYQAKAAGRARYRFFDEEMLAASRERMTIRTELAVALELGQLELWYQPLVDLASGAPRGVEALLRWNHPAHGVVAPGVFIAEAERSGLIVPIGAWVLEAACRQLAAWDREGLELGSMAVNVSGRQLQSRDVVATVRRALVASKIDPSRLELEITESTAFADVGRARGVLRELSALGVRILIDDFGSGYSSLERLRALPVDGLKIDRSFVDTIATSERDAAIVLAIVSMAHAFGVGVVAEGIETEEQLDALRNLQWPVGRPPVCERGQGYLLGRPAPAREVERLLRARVAPTPVRAAGGWT
jgi:diguanylate cyclase (GGDEF)-like protein